VINTGLLTRDARSEFFARFTPADAAAAYQQLSTRIASTKDVENYRFLGSIPRMREWGNGRLAKGLRSEAYNVENLKYEATIEVDRDELADDQTGQIRVRIGELAIAAGQHKDFLIGQLLINGATAGFNSYDGVSFFNDAHVSGASGSQDNKLSSDVTVTTAPTVQEFKDSIKQAVAQMLAFKDDQGEPMGVTASGLVIVVPPATYFTALEAINATIINNTSNVLTGLGQVRQMPWLTAATKWYLLKTDGVVRPFVFQDREPIELRDLAEGSSEEFLREKYYFGVRARYAMTYGYWQYGVETTFV
jgi:phage major head subunit gpT-like protein